MTAKICVFVAIFGTLIFLGAAAAERGAARSKTSERKGSELIPEDLYVYFIKLK